MKERTLILLKPDAVSRGLSGQILSIIEKKGFEIVAMRLLQLDESMAKRHYAVHDGKPFFPGLVDFITSGPVLALCIEGDRSIAGMRKLVGATDPFEAAPGTIRGDFALQKGRNIIHASDSKESADYELAIYFQEKDFVASYRLDAPGLYES